MQFDLFEPRAPIPVGHGQLRRGFVVTAELCWSRAAVERYDRLIAKQDGFQFLRGQREAIAQSILRHDGLEAADQAARELGLPVFSPPPG